MKHLNRVFTGIKTTTLAVLMTPILCTAQGDYRIQVDVTGNGFAHSTLVYFADEAWATYGYDGCCEAAFLQGNLDQPHVYTQVVAPPLPPSNPRLSINALPLIFEPIDIPLGFLPGTLAQYTFTFDELYTLPAGTSVVLEDVLQSNSQDLIMDSTYTTWGAVSDDEERFIIHIMPSQITGARNDADTSTPQLVCGNDGSLRLSGNVKSSVEVEIFSTFGQLLWSGALENGTRLIDLDQSLARQLTIARLTFKDDNDGNGNKSVVQKVWVH